MRSILTVLLVPLALAAGAFATDGVAWSAEHWPTTDAGMFALGCVGGLIGSINLVVFGIWRASRRADSV